MTKLSAWVRSKSSPNPIDLVLSNYLLDGELALAVEKRSKPYLPQPDRVLFREGDAPHGVYFLKRGEVVLSMRSPNRVLICVHADGGSLIGLPAVVGNKPYSVTATASEEAELRRLDAKNFLIMIESQPALMQSIVRILAEEIRAFGQALEDPLS
jgi:CRP-like cAMP-binding protein